MNRVIVFNVYSNYTVLFHTAVQCSEMSCKIFSAWHSLYPSFWLLVCVWLWSSSNFLVLWNLYTLASNFPFSFSMTWIVYLEFLLPFHVPWWNIHDCLWLFFSTDWQFTSEILPHFSGNWGTRYTRAKKIIKEWWWLSL